MTQHRTGLTGRIQNAGRNEWDWTEFAACRKSGTGLFFAPDYETTPDREYREFQAVRICDACPVINDCLQRALECRESGVWGGTNDDDRAHLRRQLLRKSRADKVNAA